MKHLLNKTLKGKRMQTPVVLIMHFKAAVYNQIGLTRLKHIEHEMKNNNLIDNFTILPILTTSSTALTQRIEQIDSGISKIVKKHGSKVHILAYSFANLPVNGYITNCQGDKNVKSVLYLSSPNQ